MKRIKLLWCTFPKIAQRILATHEAMRADLQAEQKLRRYLTRPDERQKHRRQSYSRWPPHRLEQTVRRWPRLWQHTSWIIAFMTRTHRRLPSIFCCKSAWKPIGPRWKPPYSVPSHKLKNHYIQNRKILWALSETRPISVCRKSPTKAWLFRL